MSLPRSGVSLLLGLAALAGAGAGAARAEPPVPGAVTMGETPKPPARPATTGETPRAPPQAAAGSDKEKRARQAMALHDEAWALYEEGRYRAAIDRLEAALRIDPDGRELVYNLALLHEKLADLRDA